jgi:hypothetical protein
MGQSNTQPKAKRSKQKIQRLLRHIRTGPQHTTQIRTRHINPQTPLVLLNFIPIAGEPMNAI